MKNKAVNKYAWNQINNNNIGDIHVTSSARQFGESGSTLLPRACIAVSTALHTKMKTSRRRVT